MNPETGKIDKVIITNLSALKVKYGADGVQQVQAAIQQLIAADKNRSLITNLFALDDAATMQQFSVAPVSDPTDPKQHKDAVDAIYKALAPDYILILGSIDVIPHQNLDNPMFSPGNDDDEVAFGDLPYACETRYSQRPRDFLGPTRVIGRLPDVTGANDPQYLVNLLEVAATYQGNDADSYHKYFGISAEVWEESTALSLSGAYGNSVDLKMVPPHDSSWPAPLLIRLPHFINCHGALNDSRFYGQSASDESDFPVALDALDLENNISEGTIVAAECCYGAQLFDPSLNDGQIGIANTYLANKAYGFFGSTTIAYGPSDANDNADLICRYFLQNLLEGDSLGRAALEARQTFIHTADMSDPANIKTIAQFNLYADPSITPLKPHLEPKKTLIKGALSPQSLYRAERRRDLFSRGLALIESQPSISKFVSKIKAPVLETLNQAVAEQGLTWKGLLTFEVQAPPVSKSMPSALFSKKIFSDRIHVVFGSTGKMPKEITSKAVTIKKEEPRIVRTVALIAKEVDGNIVSVKKIFSR
jgi:hypothetical protein